MLQKHFLVPTEWETRTWTSQPLLQNSSSLTNMPAAAEAQVLGFYFCFDGRDSKSHIIALIFLLYMYDRFACMYVCVSLLSGAVEARRRH